MRTAGQGAARLLLQVEATARLPDQNGFTIEFGLTQEQGHYKALGSGLASSPTELLYSVASLLPERGAFDVIGILRTPYRIDIHQPIYFVLDNPETLFAAGERDLLADIRTARSLGLHAPAYPPIEQSA